MLNSSEFDLWADGYDKSVQLSEESNTYPFAGYKKVLGSIYRTVKTGAGNKVLDIGFGTAVLTQKLYQDGCLIYGMDFSEKMIEIAKGKMPQAHLIQHDFSKGFPPEFEKETFDFILCTYAIHHLDKMQKVAFIQELLKHLSEDGQILIGDVAFETIADLERCRLESKDAWDEDEIYMVAEELKPEIPNLEFEQITFCSGVLSIRRCGQP